MLIAIGVGAGLSYGANMLDTSVKSTAELRELLQLPVLASVDPISTPREAASIHARRKTIITGLVVFVVLSQIVIKILM